MINKLKNINKKYIVLFLILVLSLIAPFTYSKYISKYTKHIIISAAKPDYMVIFDSNNGKGTIDTQSFKYGTAQSLKANTFTKEGYVFLNWNTAPDGTGTSYEDEALVNNITEEKTITLYAIYVREKYIQKGDVTFDGENGNNPIINTGICLFSEENINYDFEVSFEITYRDEKNTGYDINEYPTIMSAMSEKGSPWAGVVYRMYSNWNDQIVVNWSGNNSENLNEIFHQDGTKVTIKRINGAIYLNIDDKGDVQLLDISSMPMDFAFDDYPVTFGAGLNAQHNPQRWFIGTLSNLKVIVTDPDPEIGKIIYHPNGGTGKNLAQHVLPNTTYKLMKNTYTQAGYIFNGWNTNSDGTGTSYSDEQEVTNLVNSGGKIDLYAQWTKYSYTVNFDANDGTGRTYSQEIASGVTVPLNPSEFKNNNDGLSFAFWNTSADGSGVSYEDGDSVTNLSDNQGPVTLYAMYEQFSFTNDGELAFDGKNGSNPYIDTHIYLFSRKNANKDFVISYEINNYTNTKDYNTIISSLNESGAPYQGFVFRINDSDEISNSTQEYNFQANATTPNEINKYYSLDTTKVVIQRKSGKLSVILVDKTGTKTEEEIIDYSTFTNYFYYPLTIGASLGKDFQPMRHFIGTISKLSIILSDSSQSTGQQTESGGEQTESTEQQQNS